MVFAYLFFNPYVSFCPTPPFVLGGYTMKRFVFFLLIAFISQAANARVVRSFSQEELRSGADMIVIATPVSVKEMVERAPLPGIRQGDKPVMGTGIETSFHILTVLKGDTALGNFILHHYSVTGPQLNGPSLVSFNPVQHKNFLLYLKRASDGRYEAVSGQTDPDMSIKVIKDFHDAP